MTFKIYLFQQAKVLNIYSSFFNINVDGGKYSKIRLITSVFKCCIYLIIKVGIINWT